MDAWIHRWALATMLQLQHARAPESRGGLQCCVLRVYVRMRSMLRIVTSLAQLVRRSRECSH
jgi:hypothetical protein